MITKNFIKQCEKAEEIQKAWEPKIRDEITFMKPTEGEVYPDIYITDIDTHGIYDKEHYKREYIYLPTQEQLQKMMEDRYYTKKNIPILILNFSDFIFDDIDENQRGSMNELWLAFVMKVKYNKIWTGKKWVKVKK